jgi:hypothetical protein
MELSVLIILQADMMHKRLEVALRKSAEFTSALVAVDDRRNLAVQQPIDKGKHRQAETIREGHQDNANEHDETADKLVKIL